MSLAVKVGVRKLLHCEIKAGYSTPQLKATSVALVFLASRRIGKQMLPEINLFLGFFPHLCEQEVMGSGTFSQAD